ncbi:hypothetical protein MBLNU459_g8230t3 [Dothideomycetes sp. NU459]
MADVLPHSQGDLLRRRRMSFAKQSSCFDMNQFMDYNMNLRPSMGSAHASIPASNSSFITAEPGTLSSDFDSMPISMNVNTYPQASMVPSTMAFNANSLALDTRFTNPYNLATSFNAGLAAMPQMDQPAAWPQYESRPMAALDTTHMRNDSFSSYESCPPLIKSEDEQSPIQPSQMFYNAPVYSGNLEESSPTSSDDSTSANFSTDVDILMKAIQTKTTQPDPSVQQQNKFHGETIRNLKRTFELMREGDVVSSWEKEMWEYFGSLYKNCNKGIKGRGKDRRISNTGHHSATPKQEDDEPRRGSYSSVSSSSSTYSAPQSSSTVESLYMGMQDSSFAHQFAGSQQY